MRTVIIITGLLILSCATYAQQERQMQKPGAVVQSSVPVNKPANVEFIPAAPRQMAPLGDKPVTSNGKPAAIPALANSPDRKMKPLDPNAVVKKKD